MLLIPSHPYLVIIWAPVSGDMHSARKPNLVGTALMKKRRARREDEDKKEGKNTKLAPALSDRSRNPRSEFLVVPSQSTSLPWCLYATQEDETLSEYPGHVCDFIVRNLLAEFKTLTTLKFVDLLCLPAVRSLPATFRELRSGSLAPPSCWMRPNGKG